MIQTEFITINDDSNRLVKNPLSKSTEEERTITPRAIKNIVKVNTRKNWCDDSDNDDDSEDETQQNSDSKDESEETESEKLQKNHQLISSILNKKTEIIDNDFCIKIAIFFLNLSGFIFQIVEFKDFILKKFFKSKNIDINSLNNGDLNSIIKGNNLHYFNEILDLIKSAIPIPANPDFVVLFVVFIFNITQNDEIYRRSVKKSFDIENLRILLMLLGKKIPSNPIKRDKNNKPLFNEKGQKIPLNIVKIINLGYTDIKFAIENSEGPDAFPYIKEFNTLKKILGPEIKDNKNLAIIACLFFQIEDNLEKIVEKANLEYSQKK